MSVLPDDQMNCVINCLTVKSTWDDLILYHEGPSDVKESRVIDLKLCYNTFKFKEGESLTQTFTRYKALMNELVNDGIKLSKLEINTGFINGLPKKWLSLCQSLKNTNHVKDSELASLFGKLKYEENLIDIIYKIEKSKSLVSATSLSTGFLTTSIVKDFQDSPDDEEDTRSSHEYLNDLEKEYQARALLAKSKRDEEEVSSNDNEVTEVKALMAFTDEERVSVGKESANNGEWVKISFQKVHTLLEMEDNNDRKSFLDYLCIDLNYVEEQRNNLFSKHRNLVPELNTCKEQLLVLKQAKLDLLTMQHVNTEILKENQNLRNEVKELTYMTKAWLNSSNKVNQCISEQIPTQKKKILRIDQLNEDTSSSGQKDLINVPSTESQRNKIDHSVVVSDALVTDYDLADKSSAYSTPLPPLEKLTGPEPVSGPKTIKSILNSKSTFKVETLKGITINEPSSAPVRGNKSSSASKINSAPASKLKNVKIEDDPPLAIVMKELNELKLQISKNKSSYFRNKNSQHVPPNALQNKYKTQFKMNYELCRQNNHLFESCYEVLFCKKCKRNSHRTCDHADFMSSMDINQYHTGQSKSSSRSRPSRPAMPFPSCIHCGYNDHQSDDYVYYPICEIYGSYDHDTHGHNMIISLRRGIKPRNP
ncbi:hypothetical protein Tco_0012779 [Tanacetum coccineum]